MAKPMRILFFTQSLPWPLRRNGGSQRTELIRRALATLGEVDVVGVGGPEPLETSAERDAERVRFIRHFDTTPTPLPRSGMPRPIGGLLDLRAKYAARYEADASIVAWLASQQRERPYDLIVGRYLRAAAKAGLLDDVGVPTILDFDDIDDQLFRSHLEMTPWPGIGGQMAAWAVERTVRRISRAAPRAFAATWACSEEDAALLGGEPAGVRVLPNVPFQEIDETPLVPLPADPNSATLLFVGDLAFASNREGVGRFIREAWPAIHAAVPEATFELVGRIDESHPLTAVWRATPGVIVSGFVDDLRDAYRRAAITVAPIWAGGGTKIKVVESLALGRPCVTTSHCLRGYGPFVRAGLLEAADDGPRMSNACTKLLRNPALRADLGRRAGDLAAAAYSFDAIRREVEYTVHQACRGGTKT